MRWIVLPILFAAATALATVPGEAATKKRMRSIERSAAPTATVRVRRQREARATTRITVRKARSYLDPGTEVLPRSQPDTDYATPPLFFPSKIEDGVGARRFPLPTPMDLPGYTWY